MFWASKINEYQTFSKDSVLFCGSEHAKVNMIKQGNSK